MTRRAGWLAVLGLVGLSGPVAAQAPTPTLDKIKERGEIVIGHRPAAPPFSFAEGSAPATGYTVEVCKYIAEHVKAALKRPDIKTRYVPVDPSNGIPLVQNGTIDMECAGTGNTLERQKVVAFTYNIYIGPGTLILARHDVKGVADLKGKSVTVQQGTVQQKMLADLDRESKLGIRVVSAKDVAENVMLLDTGRADALINDKVTILPFLARLADPAAYHWLDDWNAPVVLPVSIDINRSDDGFRTMANEAIVAMIKSGEFEKNYDRWFRVPPYDLEMTKAMRQFMVEPTDKGV